MKALIEVKGYTPERKKEVFADLDMGEGFFDRMGVLRIKLNSSYYIRFEKDGEIVEMAKQSCFPGVGEAEVRRFAITVKEI